MHKALLAAAAVTALLVAAAPAGAYRSDYKGTTAQGLPVSFTYDTNAKGQAGGLVGFTFQIDFTCDGPGDPKTIVPRLDGIVTNDGSFTLQNLHKKPDGIEGKLDLHGRTGQGLL